MRRSHVGRRGAAAALVVGMVATGIGALPSAVAAPPAAGVERATHDERLVVGDDATPWRTIVVDGDDVQRDESGAPYNVFGGFGSVSCNNTGKLLLDYKEEDPEAYWRIMRLLFDPVEGAGLRHIKVELGSDSNTSSGAEPATMRSADEPANVLRGAGFHFIADALQVNPDIEVEALRWGEPSWTGNDWERRYRWYKETIDAAWDVYGIRFHWMSPSQNEVRGSSNQDDELRWTVQFAEWLERDAQSDDARYDYSTIKIVALDSYREGDAVAGKILGNIAGIIPGDLVRDIGGQTAGDIADGILGSPAALEQVDALAYHYDIVGGTNVTRLNQEHGKPVLYSEGVAPMIDPQYRINAEPERGGIGGTFGAVDIADRFINAYRWSGAGDHPAHMTTFLFQPAVGAMYEGTQYSPKHLIRASDPWSGYWEGDVGIVTVRHFHQFIEHGWEYIEGATGGDGTKGDGGTNVDSSSQTVMTARTPAGAAGEPHFTQVHANNTADVRFFEVKVADLGPPGRPLHAWQTRGPEGGQSHDANYFKDIGYYAPVRTEDVDGVAHDVYRVRIEPYSIYLPAEGNVGDIMVPELAREVCDDGTATLDAGLTQLGVTEVIVVGGTDLVSQDFAEAMAAEATCSIDRRVLDIHPLERQDATVGGEVTFTIPQRFDGTRVTQPVSVGLLPCTSRTLVEGREEFADEDGDGLADGVGTSDTGGARIVEANGAAIEPAGTVVVQPDADGRVAATFSSASPDCASVVFWLDDADGRLSVSSAGGVTEPFATGVAVWQ